MLQINQDLCTGCGICVDMCAFGALSIKNNKAIVDEATCSLCGACVNACPKGAILLVDNQQAAHQNKSDYQPLGGVGNVLQASPRSPGGRGMGRGKGSGNGNGMGGGIRGGRRGGGGRRSS